MVVKILKGFVLGLVGLLLFIVAIGTVGAYFSLDRDLTHTSRVRNLPLYTPLSTDNELLIEANGMEFRARVYGNQTANKGTVILLHGFPATSAMWMPILPALAEAGYRAIAFDQRGYSPGARPPGLSDYSVDQLVSDVFAVADSVGAQKFHLVGHDWGSAVGWATVLTQSDRVLSWTALSIAHPTAFAEALLNDPDQQSRSGYFALFTTPLVPEILLSFNNLFLLESTYAGMNEETIQEYLTVFAEPRALTSALNWYRNMDVLFDAETEVDSNVSTPTLFIWGNNDAAVGRGAVVSQTQYMSGPYKEIELDGEHWLMSSHAKEIVPEVLKHLDSVN